MADRCPELVQLLSRPDGEHDAEWATPASCRIDEAGADRPRAQGDQVLAEVEGDGNDSQGREAPSATLAIHCPAGSARFRRYDQ